MILGPDTGAALVKCDVSLHQSRYRPQQLSGGGGWWHATGIIDKSSTSKNRRGQLGRVVSDRVDTSDGPFLDKTTAMLQCSAKKQIGQS